MPKIRKPAETFDEWVGRVIEKAMGDKGMRQEDLARETGIPHTLIGRSIRGTRQISVREFEIIAGVLDVEPSTLLDTALAQYGGMEKLLREYVSEPSDNVVAFRPKQSPQDGAQKDIDERQPHAANFDREHEQDEPDPA